MQADGQMITSKMRRLWEALFSLHLSLAGVTIGHMANRNMATLTTHMEVRINHFLHIRQTDFIRGHIATWIPTALAALLIWVILRAFARARRTQEFLRTLAGIITIVAPLVFWVLYYQQADWSLAWLFIGDPFEMATALVCTILFLMGKWKLPLWATIVLLAAHYTFWYLANPSNLYFSNYAGPFAPMLGFCAAVTWVLYISGLRKVDTNGGRPVS